MGSSTGKWAYFDGRQKFFAMWLGHGSLTKSCRLMIVTGVA